MKKKKNLKSIILRFYFVTLYEYWHLIKIRTKETAILFLNSVLFNFVTV